jgi:hypothetical protein
MSKGSYHNRFDKHIVTQKPNKVKVSDVAAKASTTKLCDCPHSKPGIVSSELEAHEPECRFWKKIRSGRFAINTSVVPPKIKDGYGLGVVIGQEDF